YWTDAAFGGMPTYQLGAKYPYNFIKKIDLALRFLPRPADYLFLYFIGMYTLLLVLKIDYKLAFLGAVAFGFSTYLIVFLGVGHNAKAHAIAYMPLVLSGIFLTFKKQYVRGFLLLTVAMALELVANHVQMTYYLLFLVICIGVAYFIDALKKKTLPHYFKALGVMAVAVFIALGLNATNLLATQEYAATSTRGPSQLTINPDGTPKEKTDGLDYGYITQYSYGRAESFNLFIPNLMGGGSGSALPEDGETVNQLLQMGASPQEANQVLAQVPSYWGGQPYVAAPAYIGATVVFLAVLALFLVKGRLRWWFVPAFALSLLLSWGKNFEALTRFFIEYVPLYDKFRAVSSIQAIIQFIVPFMAIMGLHHYFSTLVPEKKRKKALLYSTGIVGGTALIFILFKTALFDFASPYDSLFMEDLGLPFVEAVREDRAALLTADAFRTLVLIVASAAALWLFLKKKLSQTAAIIGLLIIVVIDLVGVDRRYVNNSDFVQKRVMEQPFPLTPADAEIVKDTGHYRVYDATTEAFNSARASFYHNALGGYHAAKPGRVQELDAFYISKGDIGMLNMFNVKYILVQNKNNPPVAQRNPYANGNAWFVENVKFAGTADAEIKLLDSLNTKTTAIVHSKYKNLIPTAAVKRDSTATIKLVAHKPDHLTYQSSTATEQLAVFSELYYPKGWNAYINGRPAPHFYANYVLRAMVVPIGDHKIEFKFEPKVIQTGTTITLASSLIFVLLVAGALWQHFKKQKPPVGAAT
ncbi:MAG: YfhO family protein, partial [Marinirhabdus sp.]